MDNDLLCNFKKCRKRLTTQAWVTSCSHIFCNEDGLREFEKAYVCPACNTQLPGKFDIIKIDLSPTEQYKSMVLAGQRPEVILEICSRAIAFWTYQVHQEIMFQEYVCSKAKDKSTQLEQYYENVLEKTRSELSLIKQQLDATKKELDTFRKRTAELSEKLMDRSRQYQRLQALYEAQRRKFISPSFFDRQTATEKQNFQGDVPFGISAANDIFSGMKMFGNKNDKPSCTVEPEKEFVLRPAHPHPIRTPRSHLLDLEVQEEVCQSANRRNQQRL